MPSAESARIASSRRSGPGRPGLELPEERGVERDQRDVHPQVRGARDAGQELAIAQDAGGLGGEADAEPGDARHHLEHAAGHREARFRRLVGIGRGADGDLLPGVAGADQAAQQSGVAGLLDVDALLELLGVAVAEVLVRGTGIAVPAAQLAPAERVHGEAEGHALAGEAVQQVLRLERLERHAPAIVDDSAETLDEAGSRPRVIHRLSTMTSHMTSSPLRKSPGEPTWIPRGRSPALAAPAASAASAGPPTTAATPRSAAAPATGALGLGPRLVDDEVAIPEESAI